MDSFRTLITVWWSIAFRGEGMVRLDWELRERIRRAPRMAVSPEEARHLLMHDIISSGGRAGFDLERMLEALTDGPPTT